MGIFTVLVIFVIEVSVVDTNLMEPEDIPGLTPESIKSRVYGSKLILLVEQSMITVQWGCKVCLLLLYHSFTFGLKQQVAMKVVGAYVVITWVVMEVLYFGVWCQPFSSYWAVPTFDIQCSTGIHHLILNAVFNMSSDLMMLCIPIPLLINSALPPVKKAVLCVLFGLGIFVITCAALNKFQSFRDPFDSVWTYWYIREASTAIIVANMPNCWPLMRRIFHFHSWSEASRTDLETTLPPISSYELENSIIGQKTSLDIYSGMSLGSKEDVVIWCHEHGSVIKDEESSSSISSASEPIKLEIWVDRESIVEREHGRMESQDVYSEVGNGAQDSELFGTAAKTVITAAARES